MLLAATPPPAEAINIDNFSEGTGTVDTDTATAAPATETDTALSAASTVGGTRRVTVAPQPPSPPEADVRADWNQPGGVIAYSQDAGAFGTLQLFYGGAGGVDVGAVDLDPAGEGAVLADFLVADHDATAIVTLVNGTTTCSLIRALPAAPTGVTVAFPFSLFQGAGCPAGVLSDVDTIALLVDGAEARELDATLTAIRTDVFTPPAAPVISDTDPNSPANDASPEVKGTAPAGTTVRIYGDPTCSGAVLGTGSAVDLNGAIGITATVPEDQTTDLRATAADGSGNSSTCSGPFPYTEDSTAPPTPTIADTDPDSPANDDNPEVKGTAGGDAALVELYIDDALCVDPFPLMGSKAQFEGGGITVPVAANATTQLHARAIDQAGNESACSAPFSYADDSLAPNTTIDSGPPAQTRKRRVTLEFSADETATFACKVDTGAFAGCTTPFKTPRLGLGRHTVQVQATDAAGNADLTPAKRKVKIID